MLTAATALGQDPLPPLDSVVARHEAAIGDCNSVRAVVVELTMTEGSTRYDLRIRSDRSGLLRIDLRRLGISVFSEGVGSKGAWQQRLGERRPRPMSDVGAAAARHGTEWPDWYCTFSRLRKRGHSVEIAGWEHHGAARMLAVRVTLRDGSRRTYLLDSRSYLIVGVRETIAIHPDFDGPAGTARSLYTHYAAYREVGGVRFPVRFVKTDVTSGDTVQVNEVRAIQVNPRLLPGLFEGR